jgi:peroxiredoxin Q/BCP
MTDKKHKLLDQKAPDITLPNQDGEIVQLSSFIGKKPIVLFFYPKDETYGCTAEVGSVSRVD